MIKAVKRKRIKIILFALGILSIVVALVLYALSQNINLYYSLEEVNSNLAPINTKIRIGGMIKPKSIIKGHNLDIKFQITDYKNDITVNYTGILPDLFKEQQGIVVLGKLIDKNNFNAEQVLAKHDEKYMPREVADSLQQPKT